MRSRSNSPIRRRSTLAADIMSGDPLAFFADCSSTSESGDDEKEEEREVWEAREEEREGKLPSPSTLFASVGRPSFLTNPRQTRVNWDRFVKSPDASADDDAHGSAGDRYAAIPPPASISEPTEPGAAVAAPPVLYSEREPHSNSQGDLGGGTSPRLAGSKHPHSPDGSSASKKQKSDTFRLREKRKRDLGQSARGKSYVEEEKRILRQAFGKDEQ